MSNQNHIGSYRCDILRELIVSFGKTLNIGTIKDVVQQNDYDVHKSTIVLQQLSASKNATASEYCTTGKPESAKVSRVPNPQNYVSTFAIEDTIDDILRGIKILVLIRGLPGSGKSFLARTILGASFEEPVFSEHIFSADSFFIRSGKYFYDPSKIEEAHRSTQRSVFEKMLRGCSPLIVDNTNTQLWEMQPYAIMAVQCGYKIHVLEANTRWSFNINHLVNKNQHGVSKATIQRMYDRYIQNVTAEVLLLSINLSLDHQKNPQERSYPPVLAKNNCISLSNVSLNTGAIHNHNAMNKDLKLPDLWETQQGISRNNNSQCEVSKIIEISDDDDNDICEKKNDPPIHDRVYNNFPPKNFDFSAWGINERSLRSWDIVTPLKDESSTLLVDLTFENYTEDKIQKCDQSCNTSLADFYGKPDNALILYGQFRDINSSGKKIPLNKSGMLDKSCWTNNDIITDRNEDLKRLADVFQNIPPSYIRDMYDDCRGDFDMTFEIFLEDNKDYSSISSTIDNKLYDSDSDYKLSKKSKLSHSEPLLNVSHEGASCLIENREISSDNCPGVSHNLHSQLIDDFCGHQEHSNLVTNSLNVLTPVVGQYKENESVEPLEDSDSDLEFDNCPSQGESDTRSEDNNIIEFSLGDTLIEQLEKEFGDPGNDYPKGFLPVVQVPKSFARQLFAFYVESVYQQMEAQQNVLDKLVKEDEAFARKLHEEENGTKKENRPEGLQEIMNEQAAMKILEKESSQWKTCAPDDIAAQLTRKKLYSTFPTVNRDTLLEIFHANNLDYRQTVEDLLVSVDPKDVCNDTNIRERPISQPLLQELQKANQDFGKFKDQQDDGDRSSQSYREEASDYLKKRQVLYQKAQEYYSQGQMDVAQFYSQLAQKQTLLYDMCNNRAATVLLEEHSRRLQNFDTLDLHFLFVKEAIPALDVFIDRNINLLQGSSKMSQNLLVITGRGNRSKNGLSKIKPAVILRLKTRKIQFVHLNPGLLKIKVNRNTVTTSDL